MSAPGTLALALRTGLHERRLKGIPTVEIAVSPKAFRDLRVEDPEDLEHHPGGSRDGTVAYTFRGVPLMQDVRVDRFEIRSKEQRA